MAKKSIKPEDKPDNLINTLLALSKFGLLILGIIGISVEFFKDNGILKQLLSKLINSSLGLTVIPIVIIAYVLLHRWLNSSTDGKSSAVGDLPMYLMMAIGAYFLFNLLTTGSL